MIGIGVQRAWTGVLYCAGPDEDYIFILSSDYIFIISSYYGIHRNIDVSEISFVVPQSRITYNIEWFMISILKVLGNPKSIFRNWQAFAKEISMEMS